MSTKRKIEHTMSDEELSIAFEDKCTVVVMPHNPHSPSLDSGSKHNDSGLGDDQSTSTSTPQSSKKSEDVDESKSDDEERTNEVYFLPPAYIQRYRTVSQLLIDYLTNEENKDAKAVIEFGCAEFGMFKYLKHAPTVEKLYFVDLDQELLENMQHRLKPLVAEYFESYKRETPLLVEAYAGCVTKMDPRLLKENIWAVIAIELVEHLDPEILTGFEANVFGVIKPAIVIVTTPNQEFNQVFKLPRGKFRHWDHRFEWTRQEFKDWCNQIIAKYPDYSYRVEGICEGTEEQTEMYGCVSQMAVFTRPVVGSNSKPDCVLNDIVQEDCYHQVASIDYPYKVETRSPAEIILQEVAYNIDHFSMTSAMIDEYESHDITEVPVKLDFVCQTPRLPEEARNLDFIKSVLIEHGYKVSLVDGTPHLILSVEEYSEKLQKLLNSSKSSESDLEDDIGAFSSPGLQPNPTPIAAAMEEEEWE